MAASLSRYQNKNLRWLLCVAALLAAGRFSSAQGLEQIRRVYVPESQLQAVLKADRFSSVLTREDFEKLVQAARAAEAAGVAADRTPALTSAVHQARLEGEHLLDEVMLSVTTWRPHAEVDIGIAGWNVLDAKIGDQPALAARAGDNLEVLRVFLPQSGTHEIRLSLSAVWRAAGSDQLIGVGLTGAATEKFDVKVPAGKFLQAGGAAVARPAPADQEAEYSLPVGGRGRLELTLTDRRQSARQDRLTFASTAYGVRVEPGSVTWTAQTRLEIFGQSIDRLTCSVPNLLEITSVESTGLESWELSDAMDEPGRTQIRLAYRQPFDGVRQVTLRGVIAAPGEEAWSVPALRIADVSSHTGRVLVTSPANVRLQPVEMASARVSQPAGEVPAGDKAQAWDVWNDRFELRFLTAPREQVVTAAMTSLLDAHPAGLSLLLTITFQTRQAPLFDARIRLPAEYQVSQAQVEGTAATWEVVPDAAGVNEVRIPLAPPLQPGGTRTVTLLAEVEPEVWPVGDAPVTLALPVIRLPQAQTVEILYGVAAAADLDVAPLAMTSLEPAPRSDLELLKSKPTLSRQPARLGFSASEGAYSGQLLFTRRPTLLTIRTLTFFRIDPEHISTRLEANLSCTGGGLRTLRIRVEENLGADVRFSLVPSQQGAPSIARIVQQTAGAVADGLREFTLELDRHLQGEALLFTDVRLPRGTQAQFAAPRLIFPQAEAQSGFVAVESAADQNVSVVAVDAAGAALPRVDPADFPKSRYQPRERIVSGHSYVQPGWRVTVGSAPLERSAVPGAIGHRAEVMSVLGSQGEWQHFEFVQLTAHGAQSLLLKLPESSRLWSTLLDGKPVESRRTAAGVHIPLGSSRGDGRRLLHFVWSTPAAALKDQGELALDLPQVLVINGAGDEQPLELLEQHWRLQTPREVSVLSSDGRFVASGSLGDATWLGVILRLLRIPGSGQLGESVRALLLAVVVLLGIALVLRAASRSDWMWPALRILGFVGVCLLLGVAMWVMLLPPMQRASFVAIPESDALARNQANDDFNPIRPFGAVDPNAKPESTSRLNNLARDRWQNDVVGLLGDANGDGKLDTDAEMIGRVEAGRLHFFQDEAEAIHGPLFGVRPGMMAPPVVGQIISPQQPAALAAEAPQAAARPGVPPEAQAAADSPPANNGLLSLVVSPRIPEQSRRHDFQYRGDGGGTAAPALRVTYSHEAQSMMRMWVVLAGTALLGWWLRRAGTGLKVLWVLLTVVAPLAVAPIAPPQFHATLQGVLQGGLISLVAWGLRSLVLLDAARQTVAQPVVPVLAAAALLLLANVGQAAEPTTPPYVVIPYESLEQIDAAQRVWVPADLYQRLWRDAHPEETPAPNASLPLTVAQSSYQAELTGEVVKIRARWVMVSLREQPQTARLPLRGTGLTDVQLNGVAAPVAADAEGIAGVVLPRRGTYIVDASAELPAEVSRLVGSFNLDLQPTGSGTLVFTLPESVEPLRVRVNGSATGFRRSREGNRERIEIPVDRGGKLAIHWQPEQQQRDDAQLVQLESELRVVPVENGVRLRQLYHARVRQGTLQELEFTMPAALAVRQITGADVAGWELGEANGAGLRTLKLFFRRQITDGTDFTLLLWEEHPLGDGQRKLTVPDVRAAGAARESGVIALHAPPHLRLLVTQATGVQQMDASQLPASTTEGAQAPVVAAYRFASRPFSLSAEVTRRAAEMRVTGEHGISVGARRIRVASLLKLQLGEVPRRRLEITLPAGYQPVDVVCAEASDWFVTGANPPLLIVELDQPRTGEIEIGLEGRIPKLPEAPTVEVAVPRLGQQERETAQVGVWFEDVYRPEMSSIGDWRSLPAAELSPRITALQTTPAQFAFRLTGQAAQGTRFNTPRAVPALTGDSATLIAAGDASVDYGLTLRWKITAAGADRFSFTVPDWLGRLELTAAGTRQMVSEPAGNGRTRWTVTLVEPVREQYLLTAAATIPLPADLQIRAPLVEFEALASTGAAQALAVQRHFAVLVNLSRLQLAPVDLTQFESIAADQLPLTLPAALIQQAMEVARVRADKLPVWRGTRPAGDVGTRAVVLSAELRTVLEADGAWRTGAVWALRNRGQQFLGLKLPEGSRVLSVTVRGAPARTVLSQLNGQPIHLVALPQTSEADLSFEVGMLLAGRLAQPLAAPLSATARQLAIPAPEVISPRESAEFGLPVAQTLWRVHVPDGVNASPVLRGGASNITFHRAGAENVSQGQFFERLRSDVSEMARIANDSRASYQRRDQSLRNLKQLEYKLNQSQDKELLDQAQKALQRGEEQQRVAGEKGKALSDALDNREFIIGNNAQVYEGNSIRFGRDVSPDAALFNFIGEQDRKRSLNEGLREDNNRSNLKSQIRQQGQGQQQQLGIQDEFRAPLSQPGRAFLDQSAASPFPSPPGLQSQSRMALPQDGPMGTPPQMAEELAGEVAPAPAWTAAGGLSVPMTLPVAGRELAFSKVGGDPELTLAFRSQQDWRIGAGVLWGAAVLAWGAVVLLRYREEALPRRLLRLAAGLGLLCGLVGSLFLGGDLRDACFVMFCVAGLVQVLLQPRRSQPAVTV